MIPQYFDTQQDAEAEADRLNENRAPYRRWYAVKSANGQWSVHNLPTLDP